MPTPVGSYRLSPANATLLITTGRTGPAAKLGHDLNIRVNRWSAQLDLAEDTAVCSVSLEADSKSLEVLGAVGSPDALGDSDKAKIVTGIDKHMFQGRPISFVSQEVSDAGDGQLTVRGDLTLVGTTGPISFTVRISPDGELSGAATVVQTAFGITPYSAMMGALKVEDEVELSVSGRLPAP